MPQLSLAMIVKDEQQNITRVLRDAAIFCDELVVVDTGSVDDTKTLARAAGAQVYDFAWIDDFAAARNAAFAHCHGDYVIWLDADDVVPTASQTALLHLKQSVLREEQIDMVVMPYHDAFLPSGQPGAVFERERIVRRLAPGLLWRDPVHETLSCPGARVMRFELGVIEHRPTASKSRSGRNLRIYDAWIDLQASHTRHVFLYARELAHAKRLPEAIAAFTTYLARCPAAPQMGELYMALIELGNCHALLEQPVEALQRYTEAVACDPLRAEAYTLSGIIYMGYGRYERAWPHFLMALAQPLPGNGVYLAVMHLYRDLPTQKLAACIAALRDPGAQRHVIEVATLFTQALKNVGTARQ